MKSTMTKKTIVKKSNKATKIQAQNPVINIAVAVDLSDADIKNLKKEIAYSMTHPDYIMITNYKIQWIQIKINKKARMRFVYAEGITDSETKELGEQVEKAIADPNYVIVTNYAVQWIETA